MQTSATHRPRCAKAIVGMSAAATALAFAILPAGAGAAIVETHVVTPTTVTPHVVTPQAATPAAAPQASQTPSATPAPAPAAAPSPSSSAPAPSSGPAPISSPVQGPRRQTSGGPSSPDDSPDGGDLPDPEDPDCDLPCQRQWLASYRSAAQAAWDRVNHSDDALELAEALTREALKIEDEIKAETADEEEGNGITDNNPGGSAGGDPQAGDPSQSTNSSADDSATDDTDLGSWDLSWTLSWADDLAGAYNQVFPSSGADTSGSNFGAESGSSGPDTAASGDSSDGEVNLDEVGALFGLDSGSGGGGGVPDLERLLKAD